MTTDEQVDYHLAAIGRHLDCLDAISAGPRRLGLEEVLQLGDPAGPFTLRARGAFRDEEEEAAT